MLRSDEFVTVETMKVCLIIGDTTTVAYAKKVGSDMKLNWNSRCDASKNSRLGTLLFLLSVWAVHINVQNIGTSGRLTCRTQGHSKLIKQKDAAIMSILFDVLVASDQTFKNTCESIHCLSNAVEMLGRHGDLVSLQMCC